MIQSGIVLRGGILACRPCSSQVQLKLYCSIVDITVACRFAQSATRLALHSKPIFHAR